jgi:hypothetical protein
MSLYLTDTLRLYRVNPFLHRSTSEDKNGTVPGKSQVVSVHVMKTHRGRRGIAPVILNLGTLLS